MDYTYMNLIKWLGTFSLENTNISAKELSNGDIFAQILYQISPNFFTKFFVSKIDKNPQNNISIKIQNQKLIFKTILEYYTCDSQLAVIHINAPKYDNLVVGDEEEMRRMLQLIIVCAVNCENQEQHIKNLMSLEQDVQHSIMKSIRDLMNYSNSNLSNINQSEKIQEDNILLEEKKQRELNEELRLIKANDFVQNDIQAETMTFTLPSDTNEQILRLQHQVKLLEEKQTSVVDHSEDVAVYKSMLEDMKLRTTEVERQFRQGNQKIIELETTVEELEQFKSKYGPNAILNKEAEILQLENKLKEYNGYIKKAKCYLKITRLLQHLDDSIYSDLQDFYRATR